MVSRVGVGYSLIPAYLRNPGRCCIEGVLRLGQDGLMAVSVQFDADRTGECFVHKRSRAQTFLSVYASAPHPHKKGTAHSSAQPEGVAVSCAEIL